MELPEEGDISYGYWYQNQDGNLFIIPQHLSLNPYFSNTRIEYGSAEYIIFDMCLNGIYLDPCHAELLGLTPVPLEKRAWSEENRYYIKGNEK